MGNSRKKKVITRQNVGIDISKKDLKVCFMQEEENGNVFVKGTRTFSNGKKGFDDLLSWCEQKSVDGMAYRLCMEATGIYHENLAYFLVEHGLSVSVVLATQAKAYAKSLNLSNKTDKADAKMLARMGIERRLALWKPISPQMRQLKQLTRERVSLLEDKTAIGNRLHALEHSHRPDLDAIKRAKKRIGLAESQIKEVEKEIDRRIKEDEELSGRVENICRVKGISVVTVATVIAETDGFALFTSRSQLASYAGYDVVHRESGTSIRGKSRISKKGNSHIRRAMYFPAMSLVRHEACFKQLFERILKKTAIKMKAYVAVQRKALLLIYTLFTKNIPYDPEYYKTIRS